MSRFGGGGGGGGAEAIRTTVVPITPLINPHDGHADNAAYRHDCRDDRRRYRHDRYMNYNIAFFRFSFPSLLDQFLQFKHLFLMN